MKEEPDIKSKTFLVVVCLLITLLTTGCFQDVQTEQTTTTTTIASPMRPTSTATSTYTVRTQTEPPKVTSTQTLMATKTPTPTPSLTMTPLPDGYILLEDDFEAGTERWKFEPNGSKWQIQSDETGNHFLCVLEKAFYIYPDIGETSWKNYQLEFDIKDFELDNFVDTIAITVRDNGYSYYNFWVDFNLLKSNTWEYITGESQIWLMKRLDIEKLETIEVRRIKKIVENQWYSVVISMDEGNISFFWDNELVIDYKEESFLTEGTIRFVPNYGTCIDNVRVIAIGNTE
jgi:hypothetical protein